MEEPEAVFLVALFVMVSGFGYLLAVQFEPTMNKAYVVPAQNVELVEIMKGLESENDGAAQRIVDLREQLGELESRGAATSDEVRVLTQQLGELRERAGLAEATGPGVIVTLSDSSRTPTLSDDPNYFVIHDGYLRSIVNLMRRYGATAIAVNDQRVLGNSPIVCAGPHYSCKFEQDVATLCYHCTGELRHARRQHFSRHLFPSAGDVSRSI